MTDHITFSDISPRAWEHPTDRAALNALRRIPGFDVALRRLYEILGERSVRLLFKANSIQVSERQYPAIHAALMRVCETLDVKAAPELYVTQTPLVNAAALGMEDPFIVINSSLVEVLDERGVEAVIGHEVGHILSGHALYRTMLLILLRFALTRNPIVGVALWPIILGLLEWFRKSEISCDRAGLLAVQDPEVSLRVLMEMAGGVRGQHDQLDLEAFVAQSEEYRTTQGLDTLRRAMSVIRSTHPFPVLRVAALQEWIEAGHYQAVLDGEYPKRSDDEPLQVYFADVAEASAGYVSRAREVLEDAGGYLSDALGRFQQAMTRASDESGVWADEDVEDEVSEDVEG